jgi:hypothetical protein
MAKGIQWEPSHKVGGPIDVIIERLRAIFPALLVERLIVSHPGDDDNVWFITNGQTGVDVQVDTMTSGNPPFIMESDFERARTLDPDEAVAVLSRWLSPSETSGSTNHD